MTGAMNRFDSRRRLIIWQKNPSMHQTGALRELVRLWAGEVAIVYETGLPERRRMLGWGEPPPIADATTYYLDGLTNSREWIQSFLDQNRGAIHLTNAFRGSIVHRVVYPIFRKQRARWALICEKPDFRGTIGALKRLWYFMYLKRLKCHVDMFFCIGPHASSWLRKVGVAEQKIQNFGYQLDPLIYGEPSACSLRRKVVSSGLTRFVYIGQFSSRKGIDLLLSAIERLPRDGWRFDFYGHGGAFQGQVQRVCASSDRLNFHGVVEASKVLKTLSKYDVCVVPSRYDGWGFVVGEALTAGGGVITTFQTGARVLVDSSGAGIVVAPDVQELANAMKLAIESANLAEEWSQKALDYRVKLNAAGYGECLYESLIGLSPK